MFVHMPGTNPDGVFGEDQLKIVGARGTGDKWTDGHPDGCD